MKLIKEILIMNRKDKNPTTNWFLYNNVNPKNKINGDCVIRAIANNMLKGIF